MPFVTFGEQCGFQKYWVEYPGAYKNNQAKHVDTDLSDLTGQTFFLGERHLEKLGKHWAVTYEILGITLQNCPSHFVAYYGANEDETASF